MAAAVAGRPLLKAELHCHLDGSMRAETFLELVAASDDAELRAAFTAPADIDTELCFQPGWDLPRCLRSFAYTLRVMQSAAALERITFELCEDLAADGVWYGELRYCPSLHRAEGLSDDEIVAAVGRGLARASAELTATGWGLAEGKCEGEGVLGMHTRRCRFFQLLTILRDLGPQEAMTIAQLAVRSSVLPTSDAETGAAVTDDMRVVGIDLAGNEHTHPPELFEEAFALAHSAGTLGITVHAGEAGGGGALAAAAARNIVTAVERLHATRIGHGVAAAGNEAVMELLRARGVAIEVCPTSNVHTGSVRCYAEHPAPVFHRRGIAIVPCADNTLLSATCTTAEYEALVRTVGRSDEAALTQAQSEIVAARSAAAGFAVKRGLSGTDLVSSTDIG